MIMMINYLASKNCPYRPANSDCGAGSATCIMNTSYVRDTSVIRLRLRLHLPLLLSAWEHTTS